MLGGGPVQISEVTLVIRHIVFFSARDPEQVEAISAGLSLLTASPHAQRLEIGTNIKTDALGSEVDLVVYGEFADASALAAYKADPLYQRSIDIVRPLREIRMAADYAVESALKVPVTRD